MNRRIVMAVLTSALLTLLSVVFGPAAPAEATHISCSLFSVPLAHPNMGPPPYSNGASGYGQISCTGATTMQIIVQLAINGDFATVVEAQRTCSGVRDCSAETVIICCYLDSDYEHTRAAGIYDDGHGNTYAIPFTSWKCYLFNPGMQPAAVTVNGLVALARSDDPGSAARPTSSCSSYHPNTSA